MIFIEILLIYDIAKRRLYKYIVYAKGLSKGTQAIQSEMKCINEKMKWNGQDTNQTSYVANG